MKFPRPTIRINNCLAIVQTSTVRYPERVGKPLLINSYPFVTFNGAIWKGHRLSYCLNVKKIQRKPRKMSGKSLILHLCDCKWCIEPKHLYQGTQTNNSRDVFDRHPTIRQNMSKSHIGLKHKDKTKRKISKSNKGRKPSLKTIKQTVKSRRWYKPTEETKKKMSISQFERFRKKKVSKAERKRRSIAIRQRFKKDREAGVIRTISLETKKKMSLAQIACCKAMTKKEMAKKIAQLQKGAKNARRKKKR